MRYISTREEMQRADAATIEEIGIPSLVLMERAALAVADAITEYAEVSRHILIVTEKGNNGGDGLALARILFQRGYAVEVWEIGGIRHASDSYQVQRNIIEKLEIPVGMGGDYRTKRDDYDVIVDAIFGVGLTREVKNPQRQVIEYLNTLKARKIAVDIASGLDATTGEVLGCAFQADQTVTFGAMKCGHLLGEGKEYSGEVTVADIGFPLQIYGKDCAYTYDLSDLDRLPARKKTGNKGTFGKVAVIAGSREVGGAALLAAEAAYRSGCGLVSVVTHAVNRDIIGSRLPEALIRVYEDEEGALLQISKIADWADVILCGPGIGVEHEEIVRKVLATDKPLVLDADAITILAGHPEWQEEIRQRKEPVTITPHMKEMERISGIPIKELKKAPCRYAAEMSEKGWICVCKDAATVVSVPGKSCYINTSGNNAMATGGSGDVLGGLIAGLMAQGMDAGEAATLGVFVHGLGGDKAAAELGQRAVLAGDIIRGIVKVLK